VIVRRSSISLLPNNTFLETTQTQNAAHYTGYAAERRYHGQGGEFGVRCAAGEEVDYGRGFECQEFFLELG